MSPSQVALRFLGSTVLALASYRVVEYQIPRANAFPHDPAVGRDGIVWYTDQANSYIGRLDPTTGKITDFPTPTPKSGPHGIIVAPDGSVWYTANAAGRLGRLDPATGQIKEFPLPAEAKDPHTPLAFRGKIWFTVQQSNLYGALDPSSGQVRLYRVPTPHALPYGIAAAPDGSLWIALFGTNRLGHVDASNSAVASASTIDEVTIPQSGSRPRRIAVDGAGHVWYTDYERGYLGMFDPASNKFREFASPGGKGAGPYGIAIAPDGRIWYDESGKNDIVVFDPKTEKSSTVAIPTPGAVVRNMAVDSARDRLWLALSGTSRIGQIDLAATP